MIMLLHMTRQPKKLQIKLIAHEKEMISNKRIYDVTVIIQIAY